jgi:Tol biopolymer transport system component
MGSVISLLFLSASCFLGISAYAGDLQLVSARIPGTASPAGGNGNSDLPILSADGRYVVFASSAINLVTNPYAGPVSGIAPRSSQVFIRDRVAGTTVLVSVNVNGLPGNGESFPDGISANGQYVLFESASSDLVSDDNNGQMDVFLRDLVNQTTILVSVNTNGVPGNGSSHSAVMTPDARYIAFSSAASDLASADTNGIPDVFVRDRIGGTTTLASPGAMSAGSALLPALSDSPEITPDGHFVSFYTSATNLVSGQTIPGQVFVRDLFGGQTIWASTNAQSIFQSIYGGSTGTTNGISCNQLISTDGLYVVFEVCTNASFNRSLTKAFPQGAILRYHMQSGVTDLVATNAYVPILSYEDINTLDMTPDGRFIAFEAGTNIGPFSGFFINLWDGQSGTVSLVSQKLSSLINSNDVCIWPRLDTTGRYVAFISSDTNLTANPTTGYNCYFCDMQAGVTTLMNVDTNGNGSGTSSLTPPSICADGHLVAFVNGDGGIVPNDNNNASDIFVRDHNAGTTELVSAHDPNQADTSTGFASGFSGVSVSSNGLFIAFASEGSLVANDTNGLRDVYLRDVINQTNILVSVNTNGVAASGISGEPSVDASGRYVAFSSSALDLASGATNGINDIFLRDMVAGTTQLISQNVAGTGDGNAASFTPLLSSDARYVLFYSLANNLTAGGFGGLLLRDRLLGTNYALTSSSPFWSAAMTPDGRRVAYIDNTTHKLYVWDTATAQRIYTNNFISSTPSISPDGNFVVGYDTHVEVVNLVSNTLTVLGTGPIDSYSINAHFSNDGRFMAYTLNTNTISSIYLYDFQTGTNVLISQSFNSSTAANGNADSPVISPDGRFIAYRSSASNNVPADLNQSPDLMLYDRSNALTLLVTASAAGNRTANNRSAAPIFSADGKTLVFTSWASDLLSQDFNPVSDVFLLSLAGAYGGGNSGGGGGTNVITGLQMIQAPVGSALPAFSWTAQPGTFYHLQYKDDLNDPIWHDLNGSASVVGGFGTAYDLSPSVGNRFYRVISGN